MDSITAPRLISALRDIGVTTTHLAAATTLQDADPVPAALAFVTDTERQARMRAASSRGPDALLAEVVTIAALNSLTGAEARLVLITAREQAVVTAMDRAGPAIVKAVAPRLEAAKAAVTSTEDALPPTGVRRPRYADHNGYPHAADGPNGHTVTAKMLRAEAAAIGAEALAAVMAWDDATRAYEQLVGIVDLMRAGGLVDNGHPLTRSRFRLPTAPPHPELLRAEAEHDARPEDSDGTPGRPYAHHPNMAKWL